MREQFKTSSGIAQFGTPSNTQNFARLGFRDFWRQCANWRTAITVTARSPLSHWPLTIVPSVGALHH